MRLLLLLPWFLACKGVGTFTAEGGEDGPDLVLSGPSELTFMALGSGGTELQDSVAIGRFSTSLDLVRTAGEGALDVTLLYVPVHPITGVEHRREADLDTLEAHGPLSLTRPGYDWECRAAFCRGVGVLVFDTPSDTTWTASWRVEARLVATSGAKEFEPGEGEMEIYFGEAEISEWFQSL